MKKPINDRRRFIVLLAFLLITALYIWTYAYAPFNEMANSIILNGTTFICALISALLLTQITFFFDPQEPPFLVWAAFAACLWLWALAEGVWGYMYTTAGEVPGFSVADILWFLGYIALTISMIRQYGLVLFERLSSVRWAALSIWLAVVVSIETFLLLTHSEMPLVDFFRIFYVVADGLIGILALYLVYAFSGRALAVPWFTISSFVIADSIYMQLTETGVYDFVMSGISIALLADTLYLIAYLIVAWGALGQYLLLQSHSIRPEAGA